MTDKEFKTRTATVSGTGRTSFRFDPATWAAIDMIAADAGKDWTEWARAAITKRPHSTKAAAIRFALTDALMARQYEALAEDVSPGLQSAPEHHPIIGAGYYRLDDPTLTQELNGASITLRDDSFEAFTLLVGYRAEAYGGNAFVCIQNRMRDALHLFIVQE